MYMGPICGLMRTLVDPVHYTNVMTHATLVDTTYTDSSSNRHNLQTAAENDKTKLL